MSRPEQDTMRTPLRLQPLQALNINGMWLCAPVHPRRSTPA